MSEIVTMSSKGQIVVPKNLREELELDAGSIFTVVGNKDTIMLTRVKTPDKKDIEKKLKAFEELNSWGAKLAKKNGWKEEDIMKNIYKGRGVK